ncbi:MAG: adenine phosphoribosyltransferase [Pseudomonadota bacterium]
MTRAAFHKHFKAPGPVVLPVIHVLDAARTRENIAIAIGEGAPGCFLINHDFGVDAFLPIIEAARAAHPSYWIGVNFLAVTGKDAFPTLARLTQEGAVIDAYWADDARIDEASDVQPEAEAIAAARAGCGWGGLYFGGTAFKKQRRVAEADHGAAAALATRYMDVVTTSGVATGEAADDAKIAAFRTAIGDRPLALASGVTPANAPRYADVDAFLVATGINREGDFYTIDPARLSALVRVTRQLGGGRVA